MRVHIVPMKQRPLSHGRKVGFTLIELLIVIAIIAILMGLLFPVTSAVRNAARRAQAANDVQQIVTAVGAYYNEYGRYPGSSANPNHQDLFSVLRGEEGDGDIANPRRIMFLEGKEATQRGDSFRGGFGPDHTFYDPWGSVYEVRVDHDYTNTVQGPEGNGDIRRGVIAWTTDHRDEVIASWK